MNYRLRNITINNISYDLVRDFKHHKGIRTSFNDLTEITFGFSFEEWYLGGHWEEQYIPYSLLHENKVVSNVSVSKIEFIIGEEKKFGVQIGTVMTEKEYRNRGLNKFILEQVIDEWKEKSDFIYLFANDSVLDFYPKFNFEIVDEYRYTKAVNLSQSTSLVKRLDIDDTKDKALLKETVKMSTPISKLSMKDNTSLIMFYCLSIKKNSIYYIEVLRAIVIAEYEGDTLYLNDVFSKENININDVIDVMPGKEVKSVVLGFTPIDETGYTRSILKEEDALFVLKDKADYFKNSHWMFPLLSHA